MASTNNSIYFTDPTTGLAVSILRAPANFANWMRELKLVADHKNVWQLIDPGSVAEADRETILNKPIRPVKPAQSYTSQQFQDQYHDYQIEATGYQLSLSEYIEQQKRLREARTLLLATLTPTMRRFVHNKMLATEIIQEIKALYQPTDSQAKEYLYAELHGVYLGYVDSSNIIDCVNYITNIHREIRSLEGESCDEQFADKVLSILSRYYSDFHGVEDFQDRYCEPARLPRDVRTLFAKLLAEEARLEREDKLRYMYRKKVNVAMSGRKG